MRTDKKQHCGHVITWAALYEVFHYQGGMSREAFRQAVQVSRRTVSRWECGNARIPHAVYLAARLLAGDLSFYGRRWGRMKVTKDGICGTPYGTIQPNEIECFPWLRAMYSRTYHMENSRSAAAKDQPVTPLTKSGSEQEKEAAQKSPAAKSR